MNTSGETTARIPVKWEKPDIKGLIESGHLCVDMHFHTQHSDGAAMLADIQKTAKRVGCHLAVTDHNTVSGTMKLKEKMQVLPGIEVKTSTGQDLLFYFYSHGDLSEFQRREVKPGLKGAWAFSKTKKDPFEMLDAGKEYNCIASAAHPAKYGPASEMVVKKADACEVLNGGISRKQNLMALSWALKHGKAVTAGSDGHSIYELGHVVTAAKAEDMGGFLDQVRKGRVQAVGTELRYGKPERLLLHARNRIENLGRWI